MTPRACLGILRRAFERGKALPKKLERALKIQAGLALQDGQITDVDAFHINQRDEGIDLHGVSGALMATTNMQMQTFVTQPDDAIEGFDGYNGDLTGDVAATLGVNCGMSTGRNGIVAAAFSAGAGASAGGIGYGEELSPTLKGSTSGNCMPSVLCINDQGGQAMEVSEDMTGTLRAQEHGHQPLVEQEPVICITGNAIDRQPQNGGNGIGYQDDLSYTLTATDRHAIVGAYQETIGALCSGDERGIGSQYVSQDKCVMDAVYSGPQRLIRRLTPLECERLQGFPDSWTNIPGASDSARYKALGNSVAIPCVDFVLRCLVQAVQMSEGVR